VPWIQVGMVSFATSLLAVAIVVLGLGGAWAHFGTRWSGEPQNDRWVGWHAGPGRNAEGWARPCAADWSERLDPLLQRVAADLELTPAQRPAWAAMTESLRSSLQALRRACGSPADGGDSLARLRRGEAVLRSAQAAVAELRPAYEALVDTLTEAQHAKLERWLASRHASIYAAGD